MLELVVLTSGHFVCLKYFLIYLSTFTKARVCLCEIVWFGAPFFSFAASLSFLGDISAVSIFCRQHPRLPSDWVTVDVCDPQLRQSSSDDLVVSYRWLVSACLLRCSF